MKALVYQSTKDDKPNPEIKEDIILHVISTALIV
jgi:hypothetical protein